MVLSHRLKRRRQTNTKAVLLAIGCPDRVSQCCSVCFANCCTIICTVCFANAPANSAPNLSV